MSIRAGGGVPSGTAARGRRQGRLMPTLALLLGLLCVAVCMLLLFGPMYEEYANPGFLVAGAAYAALAPVLPWWIYVLLMERFTVVALIILLLVLAVLPWGIARFRQRASRSRPSSTAPPAWTSTSSWSSGGSSALSGGISWQVTRTQRSSSVTFGDDDLLVSDDGAGAGEGLMSVQDLKAMAGAAGIPWKSVYETEGGARALLEILRALHAGPSARSSSDSTRCSAAEPRTEDAPATQDAFASSSDPSDRVTRVIRGTRATRVTWGWSSPRRLQSSRRSAPDSRCSPLSSRRSPLPSRHRRRGRARRLTGRCRTTLRVRASGAADSPPPRGRSTRRPPSTTPFGRSTRSWATTTRTRARR